METLEIVFSIETIGCSAFFHKKISTTFANGDVESLIDIIETVKETLNKKGYVVEDEETSF